MPRTFCLLNHKLTPRQLEELEVEFQSAEVVCSPEALSRKWSQIHPEESREMVVEAVVGWLQDNHAQPGDLFVVQGEFGCIISFLCFSSFFCFHFIKSFFSFFLWDYRNTRSFKRI